jgi:hypothetical protein
MNGIPNRSKADTIAKATAPSDSTKQMPSSLRVRLGNLILDQSTIQVDQGCQNRFKIITLLTAIGLGNY